MTERHACCDQGLCQEAASNQTYYWSELNRPHLILKAELKRDQHAPLLWRFRFGELEGFGLSPREAANDFDQKWEEKLK